MRCYVVLSNTWNSYYFERDFKIVLLRYVCVYYRLIATVNLASVWLLDIRISTCSHYNYSYSYTIAS